jgi:tetratricopeptide (TPR) repeat protein
MTSPSNPELLLQLARQDLAANLPGPAQEKCLQVLAVHQHHPEALEILGTVLCAYGRHEEAVRVFNALTLLRPMVAAHWEHLGTVLRPTKRYAQALAAFERALQLAPPSAGLLYNLGVLQMDRCDYNAAYLALRDAVALAPSDGRIRWAFAQCCYDLARAEEALSVLEGWEKLEGLNLEFTVLIVLLLLLLGAVQQVRPVIARLLADPPREGRAALAFASILERLHRLDEARAALEQLERSGRSSGPDPERLLMWAVLADRAGEHEEARRHLTLALQNHHEFALRHIFLFPLAKACDALGRYPEAYTTAQEAHRSQLAFLGQVLGKCSADESPMWTLTAHGCDPRDTTSWGSEGPAAADSPIFVVGFPRSGTTLLEQVLDAHPQLQSMDEQPFLLRAVSEVTDRGIRYPGELGQLSAQALGEIRAHYWERARMRGGLLGERQLVDKNPLNLVLLPLIRRLFPNARIVLAVRHPCDTILSCFLQRFRSPGLAVLCTDLTTLARAYSHAFGFWYSQLSLLLPCSYELRYEQLTADFATEVRRLSTFLQLPWHEAMLAPAEHARAKGFISTPSYSQVLEPVNSRSVGRWRHYEPYFNTEVRAMLMPWIGRWGYSLS